MVARPDFSYAGSKHYTDALNPNPAFLRQAREFLFFPLPPSEASKRVSIFERETR
jgi:hypothetical protein